MNQQRLFPSPKPPFLLPTIIYIDYCPLPTTPATCFSLPNLHFLSPTLAHRRQRPHTHKERSLASLSLPVVESTGAADNPVEYQLSDMSLLANESLIKHISKDPEGYVPISVVASTKKMKSLISNSNNHMLAQALRSSSKLVVNEDGKKVRRKHPFTEKAKEELQSRTVVAENLPEDHSYQNLEKIFSVVGSVKTIRICHPHESNSSRSKGDFIISNKLHALVEYETTDIADRAVDKLSDERNWRKGLRVRLLLRCSPKSVLKNRKCDFDGFLDDDEPPYDCIEDIAQPSNTDLVIGGANAEDSPGVSKKGWVWGRSKARGRVQGQSGRGLIFPSPQSTSTIQCEPSIKQNSKGPRMPDGTRGFTMGRGKPLTATNLP